MVWLRETMYICTSYICAYIHTYIHNVQVHKYVHCTYLPVLGCKDKRVAKQQVALYFANSYALKSHNTKWIINTSSYLHHINVCVLCVCALCVCLCVGARVCVHACMLLCVTIQLPHTCIKYSSLLSTVYSWVIF